MDEIKTNTVPFDGPLSIQPNPAMNNIYFHNQDAQLLMTITHDGRLEIGPGMSTTYATRATAELLVDMFEKTLANRTKETINPDRRIK